MSIGHPIRLAIARKRFPKGTLVQLREGPNIDPYAKRFGHLWVVVGEVRLTFYSKRPLLECKSVTTGEIRKFYQEEIREAEINRR